MLAETWPQSMVERRSGDGRHRSVLLIGRVEGAVGTPVCLVHDLSAHGLMARFPDPPRIDAMLTVEIRGLPPIAGTVRWVDGHKAGLRFVEPQDLTQVFATRSDDGLVARPPRFPLAVPGRLRLGGRQIAADLIDLSAGGAKLALPDPAQPGETGALQVAGLDAALFGTLCWTRGDRAGFRFAQPLTLAALVRVLKCGTR